MVDAHAAAAAAKWIRRCFICRTATAPPTTSSRRSRSGKSPSSSTGPRCPGRPTTPPPPRVTRFVTTPAYGPRALLSPDAPRPAAPRPPALVPVTNQSLDRREMTATTGKGGTASFCQSAGRRLLRIRASAKKGLGSRRARWGWGCRASAPTWAAPASPRPIPSRPARRRRRRGGRSRPASTCSSCSPRNRLEAPRAFARTNAPSASRSAPQLMPLLPASGPSCSR